MMGGLDDDESGYSARGWGMMGGLGDGQTIGALQDAMEAALAEKLGMTVDEFQAALDAGQSPYQIASEKGISQADFLQMMRDAGKAAIEKAVADGVLTQEQGDALANSRMWDRMWGGMRGGRWFGNDEPGVDSTPEPQPGL